MFGASGQRSSKRFSLLLLEDGDDYVQDWVATAVCRSPAKLLEATETFKPSGAVSTTWAPDGVLSGRLRLCAKSFFFEPDNFRTPVLMFPFRKVDSIEQTSNAAGSASNSPNSSFKFSQEVAVGRGSILVHTQLLVRMKENGVDAPYTYEKGDSRWVFRLEYAPIQQFLEQARELLAINRLDYQMRDKQLASMAKERERAAKFDTSRLMHLSEHILVDLPAAQVTPLVREPGRLVITQTRLYFQPLHNLNNDSPVRSHPLSVVLAVARRRHSLRHVGVEVFFGYARAEGFEGLASTAGSDGPSAFYTCGSFEDREALVKMLLQQIAHHSSSCQPARSILEVDPRWQNRVMGAWRSGLISNYDYLVYLNLAAGRSFNDLTQWPVLPWVIADYTSQQLDLQSPKSFRDLSKPIGALNPTRLQMMRERCRQMPAGEKFLYGTHYSTPGYVLYWLVRAAPGHMLRLQAGRFDSPDRLFLSIPESWDSCLNNPADVKELIPHFFVLPADFLVNNNELNLGVRQNGTPVGDVLLPPWAHSPEDFIRKNRAALESEYVSSHLHLWIDLVFGHKQRGEAALAADNLFHSLTYEGAVDLEKIDDPVQRAGLEAQINEFGQVPRQLFTRPHPAREVKGGLGDGLESVSGAGSVELLSKILEVAGTSADDGACGGDEAGGGRIDAITVNDVGVKEEGVDLGRQAKKSSSGSRTFSDAASSQADITARDVGASRQGRNDVAAGKKSSEGDVSTSETLRQLEADGSRLATLLQEAEELEEQSTTGLSQGMEVTTGLRETSTGGGALERDPAAREDVDVRDKCDSPVTRSTPLSALEASKQRLRQLVASGRPREPTAQTEAVKGQSRPLTPIEASKQRLRELIASGRPPESTPGKQSPVPKAQDDQNTDSQEGRREDSWVEVAAPSAEMLDLEAVSKVPSFPRAVESSPVRTRKMSIAQTRPVRMDGEVENGPLSGKNEDERGTDSQADAPLENGSSSVSLEAAWLPSHQRNASQSSVLSEHRLSDVISDASRGPSSRAESLSEGDLLARTSSLRVRIVRSGEEDGSAPSSSAQNPEWQLLLQRLQDPKTLKIHRGPATALTLSHENGSESMTMYSVGRDGFVKVFSIADDFQVRATRLGMLPLSSVALARSSDAHPTVLAGSFDNCVYAYSVDYGRVLGKLRAHDDTVSCLKLAGRNESRLMTASWDGSIKVWALDASKGDWAGTLGGVISSSTLVPEAEMVEHDAAIWSLDVDKRGDVAVSGAEDGSVMAWDLRTPGPSLWTDSQISHPICSLKLSDDGARLLVAATDGSVRILDWRKREQPLASKHVGEKLRCCEMIGNTVLAGSEDGALHFWCYEPSGSADPTERPPLTGHSDAITCIDVAQSRNGREAYVTTASEDGTIQLYTADMG